jgi:glycosyltransferase involved in cell wall biosynthesis
MGTDRKGRSRGPQRGCRVTAQRFCFLTTFYPPYNFGGDGVGVQRLARGLAKRGHQVTVIHDADAYSILHDGPMPAPPPPDPFGVHVVTLRTRLPLVSALLTHQIGRPVVNRRRLEQLLADGSFDVINFHNVSLIGGPGLLSFGSNAVKLYFAHEHWLVCPTHVLWRNRRELCEQPRCFECQLRYWRPPQLWRYSGLMERHLSEVDTFVAMSEFSRKKHLEFGFPCEMTVLPYFLPDPEPELPVVEPRLSSRPYFLFVGRLERIKGLDDVIPIFEKYDEADLVVVGDGEYERKLRKLAAGNPRVQFIGRVPVEKLGPYYRHATAVLVPSVCYETFGITLIEAFSYQTPVIARRLGPFPEIVQQSGGGELFETPEDLLAAMRALQRSPERRRQMGLAGYEAYRTRWSESVVIPEYLEIVGRAAERRAQRQH